MPTDREHIEKWSLGYHILKAYTVFCYKIYYRTTIVGIKNIPYERSLIFAANHQNSLNDAHCIHCITKGQTVFLARSDIFKKSAINKILTYFKILPVYRIRDGYSNLQLNDDVFRKTLDVLKNHNGIGILPEGNHFGQRRLRTLKKGIARIAFQAEEACNNELKIQIIPVGLNYSHYINFRSKLLIRIGKPIDISKYIEQYRQNPALAYNALIEELEVAMKAEMIQITHEDYYNEYEMLRNLFTPTYIKSKRLTNGHNNHFEIDKKMIAAVDNLRVEQPAQFEELMGETKMVSTIITDNGLAANTLNTSKLKLWGLLLKLPILLLTLPLFVLGFANNFIPIYATHSASKKIKDVQFISSIRFAAGMFLFPIFYAIQTLVFWAISGNGIYTLYYLISLIIGGVIAYNWRKYFLGSVEEFCLLRFRINNPELSDKVKELTSSIYSKILGFNLGDYEKTSSNISFTFRNA